MKKIIIHAAIAVVVFLAMSLTVASWLGAATERAQSRSKAPSALHLLLMNPTARQNCARF